jgi:hypothetical protein
LHSEQLERQYQNIVGKDPGRETTQVVSQQQQEQQVSPTYILRSEDHSEDAYKAIPVNIRINLPGIKFPTDRNGIIRSAEIANIKALVDLIRILPDQKYKSTADVEDNLFKINIGKTIIVHQMYRDSKTITEIKRKIGRITLDTRDIRENKKELQKQKREQEKQLNHDSMNLAKT